jgi:hypothetical protein
MIESIKKSMMNIIKKIEYEQLTYDKVEIPDDIIKLSLFMLVNQAYFKIQGKATWANRLFIFALEAFSLLTLAI